MHTRTLYALLIGYGLLSLSLTPVTLAAFQDVSSASPHAGAIEDLQDKSIVEGYADGSFKPDALVNRAEFLKMIVTAGGMVLPPTDNSPGTNPCFKDFTGEDQWFWSYACVAKEYGIVSGNPDGSFRGAMPVNLAEALKMSVKAWNVPEPMYFRAPDNWYDPYMDATSSNTRLFDDLPRDPGRFLTRAETAAVIDSFLNIRSSSSASAMCGGHQVNDSYPSTDGCNTCSCTSHGEVCTQRACQANACSSGNDCAADEWCDRPMGCTACYGAGCPPCGGAGVCRKAVSAVTCYSSNDCATGQVCTTEEGDCRNACPKGVTDCIGSDVCRGVCRVK